MTTAITAAPDDQPARQPVRRAIRAAAQATGVGFDYLMTTATRESNLNPAARARTSSASGLFQFVDSTWLMTMKQHGAEFGYAREAEAIRSIGNGNYMVDDAAMREHIMSLRFDPDANAMMAGAFTAQNNNLLSRVLERDPTQGELYIAHFLGPEGAGKFISQAESTPNAPAAMLFPKAASANRPIFYTQGRMNSMSEVYAALVAQHTNAPIETQKLASSEAPVTIATPAAKNTGPVFRNLFTPARASGVSPVVAALWARREPEVVDHADAGARTGFFPMTPKPQPVSETVAPLKSLDLLDETNS